MDEATLTGETFPVEKAVAILPAETPLGKRTNAVFLGTHVVCGTATAVVVATGRDTEFGAVADRLKLRPPETDFERGVRRFGYLLLEVTLLLVIGIFAINVYLHRPVLDSFLFSVALAVGLTPQLLPAIVSVNLAHGARRMAEHKVIVKRLASIENFGSMNVLCSDKTGTLTEGVVTLQSVTDFGGQESDLALLYAYLNASFQTGFSNPIDEAIRNHGAHRHLGLEEARRGALRLRPQAAHDPGRRPRGHRHDHQGCPGPGAGGVHHGRGRHGASRAAGEPCGRRSTRASPQYSARASAPWALARKKLGAETRIGKDSEAGMTFLGFLLFSDPPKPGIEATIGRLRELGVSLKIITGDNGLVAAHVARKIGLGDARVLSGRELRQMSDEALLNRVGEVDVFAEVEPNQKERIILALRKAGHVVGYMGDGINDASALHAADVGISVDGAVDVAKQAADIVLLEKDLDVLIDGVREGRSTFANTLKYVFMATSANFGNMFSMAGASLFLPFLPLLPKQILLTNLLTDLPEMTIATDRVDPEMLARPRRWDIGFIRRFMLIFGVLSSVFDYLTFGVLLYILHAGTEQFRTGWFVESVLSAALVVLVVRSRHPFFRSRPGTHLLLATLGVVVATLVLPFLPFAPLLGLTPLPPLFLALLALIVAMYIASAELAKRLFYRHFDPPSAVNPSALQSYNS